MLRLILRRDAAKFAQEESNELGFVVCRAFRERERWGSRVSSGVIFLSFDGRFGVGEDFAGV